MDICVRCSRQQWFCIRVVTLVVSKYNPHSSANAKTQLLDAQKTMDPVSDVCDILLEKISNAIQVHTIKSLKVLPYKRYNFIYVKICIGLDNAILKISCQQYISRELSKGNCTIVWRAGTSKTPQGHGLG